MLRQDLLEPVSFVYFVYLFVVTQTRTIWTKCLILFYLCLFVSNVVVLTALLFSFYYFSVALCESNIVMAYVVIGTWLVFVCQAIGEIATLLPLPGAFTAWGARVFDEAFSFQMTVSILTYDACCESISLLVSLKDTLRKKQS